ncbi:MAG: glycoside hydrolase family 32 protein [Puniceicoccaceae bacterium]
MKSIPSLLVSGAMLLAFLTLQAEVANSTGDQNLVALSTTLKVDDSHLIVPVANYPRNKRDHLLMGIYDGDKLVQNFTVSLPRANDDYWLASYPLGKFDLKGKSITIKPVEKKELPKAYRSAFDLMRIGERVTAPDDYKHPYRDQFHVSTRRGWNNDPNGLVYAGAAPSEARQGGGRGKYHMYYQHNPFGIHWGNMHWGHFVSEDLIHWEEQPIVLYANTIKDAAFSGGGFIDFNNSAGLGKDTLFVAFTSTGRGECLAYSLDGGHTLIELPENPVVKHTGRDPKIIWYAPEQKWVMAIYNFDPCAETEAIPPKVFSKPNKEHANIVFYESKNLRSWKRTGAFTHEDRDAIFECPELFRLPVEGTGGESRWVLYGAQNRYFIGQFNGKTFKAESGPRGELTNEYSTHGSFYAAQTFSDIPDGRRIQIGWMRRASYEKQFPEQIVSQGMTLPHEITLRKTDDGIRACFNPVKEVQLLREKRLSKSINVSEDLSNEMLQDCSNALTEVLIKFEEDKFHELVINGIDVSFEGRMVRIFSDRTVAEIYIDDGLKYEVRSRDAENFFYRDSYVELGRRERLESLEIHQLKSIWE